MNRAHRGLRTWRDHGFLRRRRKLNDSRRVAAIGSIGDLTERFVWVGAIAHDVESSVDADDDMVSCCAR